MPDTRTFVHEKYGPITLTDGKIITFNERAWDVVYAKSGWRAEIHCFHWDHPHLIGLCAYDPDYIEGWGDLDEEVDDERGWWLDINTLVTISDVFKRTNINYRVRHDFKFKNIALKGEECKLLSTIQNTELVFVEFDKDIGGCSADGLGVRGHCIAMPFKSLEAIKDKKKSLKK